MSRERSVFDQERPPGLDAAGIGNMALVRRAGPLRIRNRDLDSARLEPTGHALRPASRHVRA